MNLQLASRRSLQQDGASLPATAGNQSAVELTGDAPPSAAEISPAQTPAQGNETSPDILRRVATAEQLVKALDVGALHILITAHMQLHGLPRALQPILPSTLSIRVRSLVLLSCESKTCT